MVFGLRKHSLYHQQVTAEISKKSHVANVLKKGLPMVISLHYIKI
jgi:hypothetical protein